MSPRGSTYSGSGVSALAVLIGSGVVLALKGPTWWHVSRLGQFFNSVHLWSVELFFFFMVVHLWGKYWMAAWRGGRAMRLDDRCGRVRGGRSVRVDRVSVPAELRAQWISTQAKDGMNSVGIGAFFNLMNSVRCTPATSCCCRSPWSAGRRPRPVGAQARRRAAARTRDDKLRAMRVGEDGGASHERRDSAAAMMTRRASGRADIGPMTWSRRSSIALGVVWRSRSC